MMPSVRYRVLLAAALLLSLHVAEAGAQFSKATVLLTGKVTDAESGQPLRARLIFSDGSGKELNKVLSSTEGNFSAVLIPGISYTLKSAAAQRYVAFEPVSFPASESSTQASHNVALKPIHKGTVMFNDVCFMHGSVSPNDAAATAIAAIGKAMALNNEIEVSVETFCDDAVGEAPVAADQGTQRANAVKKLLTDNGAAANRVGLNAHNPPPPPPVVEEPIVKGKKKKAPPKKKPAAKKSVKGKKSVTVALPDAKTVITIINVHSEDE